METRCYEYNKKYAEKYMGQLDEIKVRVPKGMREVYKAHAETKGMSLNKLLIHLLERDMAGEEKHNGTI